MTALALALAAALAAPAPARGLADPADALPPLALETFTLPNGLSVVLAPDHRLPQVVVNTWFQVGSKDEVPGRTGFAHLFEHLMFTGTRRAPGNAFDVLMESGGGANNASTEEDRTNFFSWGPSQLLPTLLWLDADRFQALADAMTQEKLDLQRGVVLNERRQTYENTPYGAAELAIPEAMFPEGHPYHHPVIGSHADLEAASLDDVTGFFRTFYVPGNASLVVAGDFDPATVRPLLTRWFGAIVPRPVPPVPAPPPPRLDREVRRVLVDAVELPKLYLVWQAPPAFTPGEVALDLLSEVLAGGSASRLDRRLVQELRLAESVQAEVDSRLLGSLFRVEVTGTPGADLERLKREVLAVLAKLATHGPSARELRRVKAVAAARILRAREHLGERADRLNEYRFFLGEPDGFARDLADHRSATAADLEAAARALGPGRLDLRVLPATPAGEIPDTPPPDLAARALEPPVPEVYHLASGLEVRLVRQPGSGLFAGELIFPGARELPRTPAGLPALLARLLVCGAGRRGGPDFADAVRSLGAEIDAHATSAHLVLSVSGLSTHLAPTLDLFADAALRPRLDAEDFEREAALALARVRARAEEPQRLAPVIAAAALYGRNDLRGRPVDGWVSTVKAVTLAEVRAARPQLTDLRGAVLVLAGDLDPLEVRRLIEARLGRPRAPGTLPAGRPQSPPPAGRPRLLLVDRPGAPQTVILAARPAPALDAQMRAVRQVVNVALGGSFTSRLNQNLRERHGYTYGASSQVATEDGQCTFLASASVETEATGVALAELRGELDRLAAGGLDPAEVEKAARTARHELVERIQTSEGLAEVLAEQVIEGHPPDALRRETLALDGVGEADADAEAREGPYAFSGLTVVLVGDRTKVLPQLAEQGFPAPEAWDPEALPEAARSTPR